MFFATRLKLIFFLVFIFLGFLLLRRFPLVPSFPSSSSFPISPLGSKKAGPLLKYSFENLRQRTYNSNSIIIDRTLKKDDNFTSYLFFYESDGRQISGLLNVPSSTQPASGFPVIVMLRGYVDEEIYYTGLGTERAGEYFAKNGFLTLAPDFIGFGYSDPIDTPDILEDRFQKPVEVLNLLSSIPSLSDVNPNKIFMWAHSNGGQIALSVLEISPQIIPTVLWAPVTKGFPDSLLVYMHELDDNGRRVKAALDKFELDYETSQYSIATYLKDIKTPLQVHQGTGDDLIEESWTSEFAHRMRSFGKSVEYYVYDNADHNLSGGVGESDENSWETAAARSLEFFRKF